MTQQLTIHNGRLITPSGVIPAGNISITDGIITAINDDNASTRGSTAINAHGQYIAPGFIDMHVHGGGGYDFMDGHEMAFLKIAETHAQYGTTAMLPTILTSTKDEMLQILNVYEEANKKNELGACFLGMHLEGPYFSMNQRGAQDPRYIRNPDPVEYKEILSKATCIKRWSAAPELEGAIEFGKYIKSKGVLPAIAHTDAIYEDVLKAFEIGYSLATHLYSGMSGVTRRNAFRYAGVIESAFIIDDMDVEIIADGAHLPAPLLKFIYKIKGPGRIALITDAMRAAGTDTRQSVLGNIKNGLRVIIEDGVAKLPDRTAFAGSVATADRLVRTMTSMSDISISDAVKMMSSTPARILGIAATKGELVIGKDGDIVIFDDHVNITATVIGGKVVYQRK